jgi:hypothetical protein
VNLAFAVLIGFSFVMPTLGNGQTTSTSVMRQSRIESLYDSLAALGAVAGSSLGEADTDRGGFLALSIGAGAAGGGILGALFGTAIPRWKRSYP